MPEFVTGLPLHALIVHFVVVLLPLAVLGAVVIAVWPAARERFGWLVAAVAVGVTILVPVTTDSGVKLKNRLPENPDIDRHQQLGDQMIYFAIPFAVAVVGLMILHEVKKRQSVPVAVGTSGGDGSGVDAAQPPEAPAWTKVLTVVAAVLTIGFAVAAGIHVYRVGDAGARVVWDFVKDAPTR